MKITRSGTTRRVVTGLLALGALAAAAPLSGLLAQDVVTTHENCRCVDRDGNEIENCSCFRSVGPESFQFRMGSLFEARPRLGVMVDVTQSGEFDARGARITDVMEDGPAADAGMEEGDIVVSIGGQSLFDRLPDDVEEDFDMDESIPVQRLLAIARDLEPGDEVEIEYLRDGDMRTAIVEADELDSWGRLSLVSPDWDADAMAERMRDLTERVRIRTGEGHLFRMDPDEGEGAWNFELREPDVSFFREGQENPRVLLERLGPQGNTFAYAFRDGWMFNECPASGEGEDLHFSFGTNCLGGVELLEMSPGLAEYFAVDGGVLVTDVHEESPTGLQAGDVILRIGDREVTGPERARRIMASYSEGEDVTFHILRRGNEMSVQGSLAR